MKVVFDSNVFISALLFGGKPRLVFNLVLSGKIDLAISESILEEISEVLLRPKFKLSKSFVKEFIRELEEITELVEPKRRVKVVKADPDDDRIIECAIAAKADYLISGNKDLYELESFEDILILTPTQFLEKFNFPLQ